MNIISAYDNINDELHNDMLEKLLSSFLLKWPADYTK